MIIRVASNEFLTLNRERKFWCFWIFKGFCAL